MKPAHPAAIAGVTLYVLSACDTVLGITDTQAVGGTGGAGQFSLGGSRSADSSGAFGMRSSGAPSLEAGAGMGGAGGADFSTTSGAPYGGDAAGGIGSGTGTGGADVSAAGDDGLGGYNGGAAEGGNGAGGESGENAGGSGGNSGGSGGNSGGSGASSAALGGKPPIGPNCANGTSEDELCADKRVEYGALTSPMDRRLADAVAVLVPSIDCHAGQCTLPTTPFVRETTEIGSLPLCAGVPFSGQEKLAERACSAFLIGSNLLVTAGQCLDCAPNGRSTCSCSARSRVVFGFTASAEGIAPKTIPESDVYTCVGTPRGVYSDTEDYAIFAVDRPVPTRSPLFIDYTNALPVEPELAIAGYPSGLPLKFVASGQITEDTSGISFGTSFEAFVVSIGSPVINRKTGIVHGIHVRRPYFPYVSSRGGSCAVPNVCGDTTGCVPNFGESPWSQVTRTGWVTKQVDVPLHPAILSTVLD